MSVLLPLATVGALAALSFGKGPPKILWHSTPDDADAFAALNFGKGATKILWHGTPDADALDRILAEGLRPRTVAGRKNLDPLPGYVYLARDVRVATVYACGLVDGLGCTLRDLKQMRSTLLGPYRPGRGLLLACESTGPMIPDEDWVGHRMVTWYEHHHLGRLPIQDAEMAWCASVHRVWPGVVDIYRPLVNRPSPFGIYARTGKRVLRALLTRRGGAPVLAAGVALADSYAHAGSPRVVAAWTFDRYEDVPRMDPTGHNVLQIARKDWPPEAP